MRRKHFVFRHGINFSIRNGHREFFRIRGSLENEGSNRKKGNH